MTSQTYAQWVLPTTDGIDSLQLNGSVPLRDPEEDEILVELHAASLNYRELAVSKSAIPGLRAVRKNVVPGSDGAGVVVSVGKNVTAFKPGDKVITHLEASLPEDVFPTMAEISGGLGHTLDGTLQQYGYFSSSVLVHAPGNLSFQQAATLTCSGLTAYNALFGLPGREVKSGDYVLVQGTGGVSIAALQFAVSVGAIVVATTSSEEKAERLKNLGAREVVNYRSTPEWGTAVRELTPEKRGFDILVDVGGDVTLHQALKAVRKDGLIVVSGILGGFSRSPYP